MLWRIIIWAGVSWGCGWFLDKLFEPIDPLYTYILYILPFLLFGFLYHRRIHKPYSWIHTRAFFSPEAQYRRLTFWGIPLRSEERIGEGTARTGEGILPVILTSPRRTDKTKVSVQEAFRRLSDKDIKRISDQMSSWTRGTAFLSKTMRAGKRGGKLLGTMAVIFSSQIRITTKLIIFSVLCAVGVWYFLPDKQQIGEIAGNVQLKLTKSGDTITFIDTVNDLYVSLERIPSHFKQALVFREDRRFYSHWGWDWRGKARAVYRTALYLYNRLLSRPRGSVQGGSTITQQLARTLFLSDESSLIRKFREMILAFKLEWYFDKDEILEMYLNKVFFGPKRGTYGIEVASRLYFNKSAEHLNLYEAALMIQAIPSPYRYNIMKNEGLARKRAVQFLETLVEQGTFSLGAEDVKFTPKQVKQAIQRGIEHGQRTLKPREIRYLLDWIRPQIEQAPYFEHIQGEFTVVTTLNAEMQVYAEEAVNTVLSAQVRRERRASQVALAAMTPDGAVRALLGGRDYGESQYRRATVAERQPGSTFKLFVFLAALERGWKPKSPVEDSPISIEEKEITNFDDRYLGRISLTRALALSRNTVAVRLIQHPKIGPETVIQTARRLGITTDLVNIPGLALGISEVTLLELTSAYCVFANGGFAVEPYGVVGVRTKRGNVRYWHQPARRKILQHINLTRPIVRKSHASAMNSMLKAVITDPEGTGRGAQFGEYELAGKTGTTDGYRDAWFVGFTSHLCTGVWIGNDDNTPMRRVSGGKLPVDIFREFMRDTHKYLHFENQPLP